MTNHDPAEQPKNIQDTAPTSTSVEGHNLYEHFDMPAVLPPEENQFKGIDRVENEDQQPAKGSKKIIAGGAVAAVGLLGAGFVMGNSGGEDAPSNSETPANVSVDEAAGNEGILDTPPSETTITVESEQPAQTSETQDSPNYTYLSDSESALLDRLHQDGYPTTVVGNHEFDSNNPEGLLVSVGNDILAALNTRDLDAFVQAIGGNERSDMANHEDMQRQIEALDDFYALEDYVRLDSCSTTGNEVTCSGYIGVFAFNSSSDLNNPDTVEFLENPVLEKPTNSGQRYLELVDVRFNTETGELINAGHRIVSHEPSLS